MNDRTGDVLKAFVEASDERKELALQVLRGEAATCPYRKQGAGREEDRGERLGFERRESAWHEGAQSDGPMLINMKEAAKLMGVSRPTLWRITKQGRLPKVEILPGSYRLRRADVEAFARNGSGGAAGAGSEA